ncbi:MAG: TIGR04211 family SH3 domain-containing protein [Chromatiales bacterium]|jgi:SH3 domain protein
MPIHLRTAVLIQREVTVRKLAATLLLAALCSGAQADTRYVTDQLKVTMRRGESTEHRIMQMLPSGSPVEVLSSNPDTGYSRVRAGDGEVGYVLTRQLMDQPSARDRLAKAEQRLAELQDEPGRLSAKLATLQEEHAELTEAYGQLQQVKNDLQQELEALRRTSANAVRIAEERNDLRKTMVTLTREVEELKQQNRDLRNDRAQRWFLIGAGVVLVGIVLGLLLPHLRFQRRKSSWGSL